MLEQSMQVSICVCKVCATGQSASGHHIMEHNGRQNLPMSTGCITTDKTWTLNLGSEETCTTQL